MSTNEDVDIDNRGWAHGASVVKSCHATLIYSSHPFMVLTLASDAWSIPSGPPD